MQKDEAIEIIRKIKAECENSDDTCAGCIFYSISECGECPLVGNPDTWDI